MQPTLKTLLLFSMCILSGHLPAQHHRMHPDIPADTSYNVQKELVKHRKKYPFIQIAEVVHSEGSTFLDNLTYHRIDQRDLHLDLFLPKQAGSTAAPLVIMIHGGGWRSGNKDMDHPMAAYWAANGYIAACVEYRLSMEAQYPAQIQDIKTAIRWLKLHAQRFAIDTTKVAIMGCSAGGQLAALIGSRNDDFPLYQTDAYNQVSDRVQAVIDFDGVLAFLHPDSSEGKDRPDKPSAATQFLGIPAQDCPDRWNEASALHQVNPSSAPILFVNSSQPRFSAGQQDMMHKLDALGIPNKAYLLEGTPHSFWLFQPWMNEAMQQAVQFLDQLYRSSDYKPNVGERYSDVCWYECGDRKKAKNIVCTLKTRA